MKKCFLAVVSLMWLSSPGFAAQSRSPADDEDAITAPVPKKVNMRPVQVGNFHGSMAPGVANSGPNPAITATPGTADASTQPAVKVGKYLPSNRMANTNSAEIPGTVGNSAMGEGVGTNVKINHKNINQRTMEKLGENFD